MSEQETSECGDCGADLSRTVCSKCGNDPTPKQVEQTRCPACESDDRTQRLVHPDDPDSGGCTVPRYVDNEDRPHRSTARCEHPWHDAPTPAVALEAAVERVREQLRPRDGIGSDLMHLLGMGLTSDLRAVLSALTSERERAEAAEDDAAHHEKMHLFYAKRAAAAEARADEEHTAFALASERADRLQAWLTTLRLTTLARVCAERDQALAERDCAREFVIYTPCHECGLPDPFRKGADCPTCTKARAALTTPPSKEATDE